MCTGGSPSSNGSQAGDSTETEQQPTETQPQEQTLRSAIGASTIEEILAEYGENLKLLTPNSQVAELLTIIRDK